MKSQRGATEEDRIFPVDISITAQETANEVLKPWALAVFPPISPYAIKFEGRIQGDLHKGRYKDKPCIIKISSFSQSSLTEIFAREKLGGSIGKEMVAYGLLSVDYKPSRLAANVTEYQKGDVCIFFGPEDHIDFPLDFQDPEMCTIMLAVRSMIGGGLDISDIGDIAITKTGDHTNLLTNNFSP